VGLRKTESIAVQDREQKTHQHKAGGLRKTESIAVQDK